jgi:hypothetical protein
VHAYGSASPINGRVGDQRPRVCTHPQYTQTLGPIAVELSASAGLILDPWQRYILDVMCAVRADGRWVCFECGIVVPRQNGKGSVYEARALAGLFLFDERLIMWSAHEYKTAMEGFRRVKELIDGSDDLRKQVRKVINTNGEEGIELLTGQRLRFIARSKGSGRGFSGDCNLLDEWFAGQRSHVAALMPTVSARPNPQLVYASSPPIDEAADEEGPGEPLYAMRERGEAGDDPSLAWFDWSACDIDPEHPGNAGRLRDIEMAYRSNPALGIRITEETVRRELRAMSMKDYARERLCIWPVRTNGANLIDPRKWGELVDIDSELGDDVAIAVDITPGRDWSSIVAYGERLDGVGHVEVIDHRPGTDWIVDRLLTLADRWKFVAVGLDPRGPAASLLIDLDDAGFARSGNDPEEWVRGQLAIPSTQDVSAAGGQLVDAVNQGTLRHLDQAPLSIAIAGAKTRPLGDAWAWARRLASVDISPLCAATIARWAYASRIGYVKDEYDVDANIG